MQEYIEQHLRPLQQGERPASRKAINTHACEQLFPGVPLAQVEGQIQLSLREHLLAPAAPWQSRVDGKQQPKTPVYKYSDGNLTTCIHTLR